MKNGTTHTAPPYAYEEWHHPYAYEEWHHLTAPLEGTD